MADSTGTLHTEVTTELSITQVVDGVAVAVNADSTPSAEITRIGVVQHTISPSSVLHPSTGVYTFTWTPTVTGVHVITWTYQVGGEDFTEEERIDIQADVDAVSDSDGAAATASTAPDIGTGRSCLVTGHFVDAGGNNLQGVYVRFTPDRASSAFLTNGAVVASEVTVVSDEDGVVEFYLARGLTGLISVSGMGIVRRVTVPDTGEVTLQGLVELGDDLLEVQRPRFVRLPRRS